jgi:glycosyltransferase involved in cell wall biosynthesis
MSILIISPEAWSAQPVSKHHYASALAARGHRVVFLDPPDIASRDITIKAGKVGLAPWIVSAPRVAPGLRLMPSAARRLLEARWLARLEDALGWRVELVWLFENSRFFDMSFAGDRVKIYQQVDLNQDFHPLKAAETADLSIAISGPIERRLESAAKRLLRLSHGVASGPESPISASVQEERFSQFNRNVVLTGNLDISYLNVELLAGLVRDHPEVCFHFIGSYRKDGKLFRLTGQAPNVIWWGRQPSGALPSILREADLLLVTYLAETHREQLANPHKIMEYLASGSPVLATYTEEYAERSDLIWMATSADDFRTKFAKLIRDPEALSDTKAREVRKAFAAKHTYERQIDRIAIALDAAVTGPNPLRNAL